jgi:hypothetical protein
VAIDIHLDHSLASLIFIGIPLPFSLCLGMSPWREVALPIGPTLGVVGPLALEQQLGAKKFFVIFKSNTPLDIPKEIEFSEADT